MTFKRDHNQETFIPSKRPNDYTLLTSLINILEFSVFSCVKS